MEGVEGHGSGGGDDVAQRDGRGSCKRTRRGEREFALIVVTQRARRLTFISGNYHHFHLRRAPQKSMIPRKQQLPVEEQRTERVVFSQVLLKRLKWSKQVCFPFHERGWFVFVQGPDRYSKGCHLFYRHPSHFSFNLTQIPCFLLLFIKFLSLAEHACLSAATLCLVSVQLQIHVPVQLFVLLSTEQLRSTGSTLTALLTRASVASHTCGKSETSAVVWLESG